MVPRNHRQTDSTGNVPQCKTTARAITDYIDEHNKETKAFKWTAQADTILAKVQRARAALDKMQTE